MSQVEGEFEVRNPEIETKLKDIGHVIAQVLDGSGHGFALLIFSYGEGGEMFYASNAQRKDIINAMREFIAKNETN